MVNCCNRRFCWTKAKLRANNARVNKLNGVGELLVRTKIGSLTSILISVTEHTFICLSVYLHRVLHFTYHIWWHIIYFIKLHKHFDKRILTLHHFLYMSSKTKSLAHNNTLAITKKKSPNLSYKNKLKSTIYLIFLSSAIN